MKIIPFIIASKRIKYLAFNLTKERKDLYNESYKRNLMKDIKEDIYKWKHIPCSWIRKLNIVKEYYPEQSTESMKNPYQNPNNICCRNRKTHPEIHMESQGTQIVKTILKKNKVLKIPDFKTYYRAVVIKTLC